MKCDVLVIGAGPAGSSAAYASSEAGLKTVIVERKKEVGVPVTCSGAIGSYLLPFLPFKVPRHLLEHKVEGVEFLVDNFSIVRKGSQWTSYAINRSSFDGWLANRAEEAGANLLLGTEFMGFEFCEDGGPTRAIVMRNGGLEGVEFEVVIGADGTDSTVLRELGVRRDTVRFGRAVVFEYEEVNLRSPTLDQVYFGDFAPGGYAHIFPISENRANVGVGSIIEGVDVKKCFNEFLLDPVISPQLKGAKRVREKSGTIAFGNLSDSRQYGNALLAGDAATQNIKPLVEGFLPSVICGDIAGKTAVHYLQRGEPLDSYQTNLDRKLGPIFKESDRLAGALEDLIDIGGLKSHLLLAGLCSNTLSLDKVARLKNSEIEVIKTNLLSKSESGLNMAFLSVLERVALFYLQARGWLNSKLYKL